MLSKVSCGWTKSDRQKGLAKAAGGWTGGPAILIARPLDQQPSDDERGGQEEIKVNDDGPPVGAAADLAVAVHPRVGPFDDPAPHGLDGCGNTLAGDFADE